MIALWTELKDLFLFCFYQTNTFLMFLFFTVQFSSSSCRAWPVPCTCVLQTQSWTCSFKTPFCYLPHSPGWCWSCQQSSALQTEAWNKAAKAQNRLSISREATDRGVRDSGKGSGLESVVAAAAGEKRLTTDSEKASGPGLPRTHHQLLLDCLLESDRATTSHMSDQTPASSLPLSSPLRNDHRFPSLLRKLPIQSLYFLILQQRGSRCILLPSDRASGRREHVSQGASLVQTTGVNLKYLIRAASGINYSAAPHSPLRRGWGGVLGGERLGRLTR